MWWCKPKQGVVGACLVFLSQKSASDPGQSSRVSVFLPDTDRKDGAECTVYYGGHIRN